MENFGIDIGDFKTVITGTSKGNRIIRDPIGKRTINTRIQLSTPRKFGNELTGFKLEDLQKRFEHFFYNLDSLPQEEKRNLIIMYLSFLKRVISLNMDKTVDLDTFSPIVHLVSKLHNLIDIQELYCLAKAINLNIQSIYDDLTAAASFVVFKIKPYKKLLLIDFGHSQTGIGQFTFDNGQLITKGIKRISVGGGAFDEKLLYYLMGQISDLQKTDLPDKQLPKNNLVEQFKVEISQNSSENKKIKDNLTFEDFINQNVCYDGHTTAKTYYSPTNYKKDHRFLILRNALSERFQKWKTILSNTEEISDHLEFFDQIYTVSIKKQEYLQLVKEEISIIQYFIEEAICDIKEESDWNIETIGGNTNNFLIKEMLQHIQLPETLNFNQSCDPHETVSFGLTIAGALSSVYNPYNKKVIDCLRRNVFVNGVLLFKNGDFIGKEVALVQEGNQILLVRDASSNITQNGAQSQVDSQSGDNIKSAKNDKSENKTSDKHNGIDSKENGESANKNVKQDDKNQDKKESESENADVLVRMPFKRDLNISYEDMHLVTISPEYPCSLILNRNKTVSLKGKKASVPDFSFYKTIESSFRKKELELEHIGKIINDLQTFIFKVEALMNEPIYFSLFKEDEISRVSEISMDLLGLEISSNLEDEEKKIEKYRNMIQPYIEKMKELVKEKKNTALEKIDKSYSRIKNIKIFTPTLFKLQSKLNGDKDKIENLQFDSDLSLLNIDQLDQDIAMMEIEIDKEIIHKEKEENERKLREQRAKEELMKKQPVENNEDHKGNKNEEIKKEETDEKVECGNKE